MNEKRRSNRAARIIELTCRRYDVLNVHHKFDWTSLLFFSKKKYKTTQILHPPVKASPYGSSIPFFSLKLVFDSLVVIGLLVRLLKTFQNVNSPILNFLFEPVLCTIQEQQFVFLVKRSRRVLEAILSFLPSFPSSD